MTTPDNVETYLPASEMEQAGSALPGHSLRFTCLAGFTIERQTEVISLHAFDGLIDQLERYPGMFLGCGVEDQRRYHRKAVAFCNPPLELIGHDRQLTIKALNPRGEVLLPLLMPLISTPDFAVLEQDTRHICLKIAHAERFFAEEMRSLQPSVLSPIRRLIQGFAGTYDPHLGFYGAFGYDLAFQFESIEQQHVRPSHYKNLHLYFPDEIYLHDPEHDQVLRLTYEFAGQGLNTLGISRTPFETITPQPPKAVTPTGIASNLSDQAYTALVDDARAYMQTGNVFELVLHRRFSTEYTQPPSALFRRLRHINPSPYEFILQMGDEQLVGTSPEMFVRVQGQRVESSPVSGTIRRGSNTMEDADRILALLNSQKDETELNMCTDVDRNDKARVCQPGTVKLLGRRLIELYAGLIHTADHVEGMLRDGLMGIDAFLSHMWAVTLTGAPKRKAMQLIEALESDARGWYGGAVGALFLNGDIDTGITIRTAHLQDGHVHYRAGATLVYDSIGTEEERETRTKATAFFRAIEPMQSAAEAVESPFLSGSSATDKSRIILIDYEDSFVHTLADYFRQAGAEVMTFRHVIPTNELLALKPDLVVHSPGPGKPSEFGLPARILALARLGIPQFGVCLGLQGIVEAFGGELGQLDHPRQGKRWTITHAREGLFNAVPSPCTVGAYHALYAMREHLPEVLQVTAENEHGLIMAVRHCHLPIEAVQFHPESILSMGANAGLTMIRNVVGNLQGRPASGDGQKVNVCAFPGIQ